MTFATGWIDHRAGRSRSQSRWPNSWPGARSLCAHARFTAAIRPIRVRLRAQPRVRRENSSRDCASRDLPGKHCEPPAARWRTRDPLRATRSARENSRPSGADLPARGVELRRAPHARPPEGRRRGTRGLVTVDRRPDPASTSHPECPGVRAPALAAFLDQHQPGHARRNCGARSIGCWLRATSTSVSTTQHAPRGSDARNAARRPSATVVPRNRRRNAPRNALPRVVDPARRPIFPPAKAPARHRLPPRPIDDASTRPRVFARSSSSTASYYAVLAACARRAL